MRCWLLWLVVVTVGCDAPEDVDTIGGGGEGVAVVDGQQVDVELTTPFGGSEVGCQMLLFWTLEDSTGAWTIQVDATVDTRLAVGEYLLPDGPRGLALDVVVRDAPDGEQMEFDAEQAQGTVELAANQYDPFVDVDLILNVTWAASGASTEPALHLEGWLAFQEIGTVFEHPLEVDDLCELTGS